MDETISNVIFNYTTHESVRRQLERLLHTLFGEMVKAETIHHGPYLDWIMKQFIHTIATLDRHSPHFSTHVTNFAVRYTNMAIRESAEIRYQESQPRKRSRRNQT